MSTKVGLLGGSFDPVHLGHIQLAVDAQTHFDLNSIVLMPAYQSPFKKDYQPSPAQHRLKMVEAAIQDHPGWTVSDIEIKREGYSYTADTLSELERLHPQNEWFFIMGMDTFAGFPDWARVEEILSVSQIVVAKRPGYDLSSGENERERLQEITGKNWKVEARQDGYDDWVSEENSYRISFFQMTPMTISSSEIRQKIGHDASVKKMLPPQVVQYIMKYLLYQHA